MRLIDADALKIDFYDEYETEDDAYAYGYVSKHQIDMAPTIDAVCVVRCKDCVDIFHDDWYKCFACANLYGLNEEVKPNDYCSHGERKTEQTERSSE